MRNISIFGTSSDAGKSTLTLLIGLLLQDKGLRVTPFKAQNVSNNAKVADDGSEIAISQYFQAEILGVPTSYHLNPVLLKSGHGNATSLIVNGKAIMTKDVREYYRDLEQLKPYVNKAFSYLNEQYDCVICEGAGSPVELNLMDKDLSNIYVATQFQTQIILVADIEKGGVFASIYGVYHLLPPDLRPHVKGVIINKFRGDETLFDEGITIIEKQFGIPVLGLLPYYPLSLGFEDSMGLHHFHQKNDDAILRIGIVAYPTMSNYNDFEPLLHDNEIELALIQHAQSLEHFDMVILPGSKLVLKDLQWLYDIGLYGILQQTQIPIFGICGGFEMMFDDLYDDDAIENKEPLRMKGLGFFEGKIEFCQEKIVRKGEYSLFGQTVQGFEIHHGKSQTYPLYADKGRYRGTFVHAIFDDNHFRTYICSGLNSCYQGYNYQHIKKEKINAFVQIMKPRLNLESLFDV